MKRLYHISWLGFRGAFAVYCRWRVFNPERVPLTGPVILASNHASIMDPPLIGCGIRRGINYLARESLFRIPVFGWWAHRVDAVPVDRDGAGAKGLRNILERLLDGGGIILFPEGTRTPDGSLQPARPGVGLVVVKSTAPVVPVRVFGTFAALNRFMVFPRPRRVMVKYGKPMDFSALRAEAQSCPKARLKEIYQQVSEEIMAAVAKLEPKRDE
ncbi:MAG: 1-acyl-sn-glycerol-3-phosphate acyltransferase [Verrucomicrobia bacterium]|nr:1-acyl-sn-glycerol-3-phosphate acyltransferase [Verrucomicrobiota bacterium]